MKGVSRDAYMAWKDNEVTKRFMEEIAFNLKEAVEERICGTPEQMLRAAYEREQSRTNFELILGWKPSELEEN